MGGLSYEMKNGCDISDYEIRNRNLKGGGQDAS
jgi:hypothetical protein